MYFTLEPKSEKKDFFNYDFEYASIKNALREHERIIAIIGVRRVGKTSMMNVIYNETKTMKLWLDGRIVSDPKREVFSAIYEVASSGKSMIFGKIESLNVSAFGLGIGVKVEQKGTVEMERKITSSGSIKVFIDEAQRMDPLKLAEVLSYFYDRVKNVSFILSGSEVGLVEDILGETDAEHPLYGRHIVKIKIKRLDQNRAMEFLSAGFSEIDGSITQDEINEAISELDGLIGWLTLFGHERGVLKNKNALNRTVEIAKSIAGSELVHFLKKSKNRRLYLSLLHNANGVGWKELRLMCGRELGKLPGTSTFSFVLERLKDHSFIEKRNEEYYVADPLIFKASLSLQ